MITVKTYIYSFLLNIFEFGKSQGFIDTTTKHIFFIGIDSLKISWEEKDIKYEICLIPKKQTFSLSIVQKLRSSVSTQWDDLLNKEIVLSKFLSQYLENIGKSEWSILIKLYYLWNQEQFMVSSFESILNSNFNDIIQKINLINIPFSLFNPLFSDLFLKIDEIKSGIYIFKKTPLLFKKFSLRDILLYESITSEAKKIACFFLEKKVGVLSHYPINDLLFLSLFLTGLPSESVKSAIKDLTMFSCFSDFYMPTLEELQIFILWEPETKKSVFSAVKELYPFRGILETGLLDLHDFSGLNDIEQSWVLKFLKKGYSGSPGGKFTLFSILRESGRWDRAMTEQVSHRLDSLLGQEDVSFRRSDHVLLYCLQRSGSSLYHKILSEIVKYYQLGNPCIIDDVYNIKFPENTITDHGLEMKSVIRNIEARYPYNKAIQNLSFLKLWCPIGKTLYGTCRDMLSNDFSLLPGMRFIILTRDPRDIYLSMRAKDEVATLAWVMKERAKMEEYTSTLRCEHVLPVKYEDLMTDFQKEYGRLLDFLWLPFNLEIFGIIRTATSFETMSGGRKYGEIIDGAYFRGGSDWRKEFTSYEKKYCQEIYGKILSEWGYHW